MAVLLPSANVTSAGPLNAGSLNFASTAMVDAPTLVLRVRNFDFSQRFSTCYAIGLFALVERIFHFAVYRGFVPITIGTTADKHDSRYRQRYG